MSGIAARIASCCALLAALPGAALAAHVSVIRVEGTINPASSAFIQTSIEEAAANGSEALVLELDTPGGLVASTKDIIKAMLNAEVPVIVYVSPSGAWAGSAGTFITLAGHVAAMAPGTSIGAASPVGVGGGGAPKPDEEGGQQRDVAGEKAENLLAAYIESIAQQRERNVEWAAQAVREAVAVTADEALELGVIDLVAANRTELLAKSDGREVDIRGEKRPLALAGAAVRTIEMTAFERFLHVIASPDIAVLLLMAGLLGLYMEFSNPGLIVPGAIGAACLIIGAISLQILPFDWLGLILFVVGVGLLMAELFITSYGLLFAAGIGCMLLGGSMVFDMPDVSDVNVSFWSVLFPAVMAMGLFAAIVIFGVGRTIGSRQTAGVSELIGMVGRADTALGPEGRVLVRGEYWDARADAPVAAGDRVEVVEVRGMRLRVRPVTQES